MTEPKCGPSIKDLIWWVKRQVNFHQKDPYGNPDSLPYYQTILRILKAASLVKDKTLAIQWFFQARSDFYFPYVKDQIRALLEALPGKEENK